MSRFLKGDVGKEKRHSRWREQQVQKPGDVKASLPPSPPPPQYIPLRAWLYRDGFARFSNTRFTLNSIDDQCILGSHLPIPYALGPSRPLVGPERAHPFHKCLLSSCGMPSSSLGTADIAMNKTGLVPSLRELPVLWG